MKKRFLASVLVILIAPCPTQANPVPDWIATRFRDNVLATSRDGSCPDTTNLIADLGSFGLDLLSPEHVKAMEKSFGAFAPLIVASQRTGKHRSLSYELQRFYWLHASSQQRVEMLKALREWLTAEITEASAGHSMVIAGPPEQVRRSIDAARVKAAEMLSDRGDRESLPFMVALERRGLEDPNSSFVLRRAMARLRQPCAMTFIHETPNGRLECCEVRARVLKISLGRGDLRYPQPKYSLGSREVDEFWSLIHGTRKGPNSNWFGSNLNVFVEFEDGVIASMSPIEPGRLTYRDNVTLDWRHSLTLQSDSLYNWVLRLAREKLGEDYQ